MTPPDELTDTITAIFDDVMSEADTLHAVDEWRARMKQRDARRLREGWTPEQVRRGSRDTRPSDGQPSGAPFDYDEYETRKADAKAADPEKFSREKAARRREREEMGQRWRETHDFDNCNAELKQLGIKNRLLDIWSAIVQSEQAAKIDAIYLDQASRIANTKNRERVEGRQHGIGAAARRAGY